MAALDSRNKISPPNTEHYTMTNPKILAEQLLMTCDWCHQCATCRCFAIDAAQYIKALEASLLECVELLEHHALKYRPHMAPYDAAVKGRATLNHRTAEPAHE